MRARAKLKNCNNFEFQKHQCTPLSHKRTPESVLQKSLHYQRTSKCFTKYSKVFLTFISDFLVRYKQKRFPECYKELKAIHKINRQDPYNNVALGNYHLANRKYDDMESLHEASKWFYSALNLNKNNVYAANGLAVCLAELNLLSEAKIILEQVMECS